VGLKYNVIQVQPMTEEDALRLLKTRIAVSKSSEGDARALVQALGGIPLAVTHAAAYVAIREPRINVSTYLELYRESEENQTSPQHPKRERPTTRQQCVRHSHYHLADVIRAHPEDKPGSCGLTLTDGHV